MIEGAFSDADLGYELAQGPLLAAIYEDFDADAGAFELTPKQGGFELRRAAAKDRAAGRPRLRFFAEGKDRVIAFFYKPSRLTFSSDRFSYGALYLYSGSRESALEALSEARRWLAADFKPGARPAGLKRSLQVTIPDD